MTNEEVSVLYWGEDGIPTQWKEISEVAKILNTSILDVRTKLGRVRNESQEYHKYIWDVLVEEFSMTYNVHFKYRTRINMMDVSFMIIKPIIGLNTDSTLQKGTMKIECVSSFNILTLSTVLVGDFKSNLIRHLKKLGVRKVFS